MLVGGCGRTTASRNKTAKEEEVESVKKKKTGTEEKAQEAEEGGKVSAGRRDPVSEWWNRNGKSRLSHVSLYVVCESDCC